MTRQQVYAEITEMFGLVPSFFKSLPDHSLELDWRAMKAVQFEEGPVPNKYRELIGLGIAAVTKCKYCTYFHTVAAKLNGATDEEIQDTLRYAMNTAGWSTWLNGGQFGWPEFKQEIDQMAEYIRRQSAKAAA